MSHTGISMSQQSNDQKPGSVVAYKDLYYGKTGVAGEMSPRDECEETGNLRKPSSGMASESLS